MSASSPPYFFISYSRRDKSMQRKVVRELRERGVNVWVDIENLTPGTAQWEREVERSIRDCIGVIVLLSPSSNDSQWVRREISFAEENDKIIFPVHISGDENDSIPLRLSAHQRVDLRSNFEAGLTRLIETLDDFSENITYRNKVEPKKVRGNASPFQSSFNMRIALFALIGIIAIGGIFGLRSLFNGEDPAVTQTPPDNDRVTEETTDPAATEDIVIPETDEPTGKIIYTCEIQGAEVCIINADGSGWRQLTDNQRANYNASLSPDGQAAVYVSSDGKTSEIYELIIATGNSTKITDLGKSLGSPEISPNNQYIVFHYLSGNLQLWIMNRNGNNPRELYSESGRDVHDGTWSPDGSQILFALGKAENNNLYVMDFNGRDPQLLNNSIDTRGRSDWGVGDLIAFDMGGPWAHDVYTMNADGSNLRQVSPAGINAQGASLSPDGNWIAFTAYTDVADQDQASCEIFIMRADGSDVRQLTDNNYCDFQPRWGN